MLSKPTWGCRGYAWDEGPDIRMEALPSPKRNYISGVELLTPMVGMGDDIPYDRKQLGGKRGRMAVALGIKKLILDRSNDYSGITMEDLQTELYEMGAETALNMDGGGSAQGSGEGWDVKSSDVPGRKVHNYLCIWLKKDKEDKPVTEQQIRANIVSTARAFLGAEVGGSAHKDIIGTYNAVKPLPRGYKMTNSDAWCAAFVSAIAVKAALTDIIPPECSCNAMIQLFQALGCWEENDAFTPQIGDILFYDWDDNGIGDNKGAADHVGIVSAVTGATITVIEGNYNKAVRERTMYINGRYIRGYGLPDYAAKADKPAPVVDTYGAADWAASAWAKAKDKGIMDGTRPTEGVSRQELAVVLDRMGLLK